MIKNLLSRKLVRTILEVTLVLLLSLWFIVALLLGKYYAVSFALVFSAILMGTSYMMGKNSSIKVRISSLLGIYIGLIIIFGAIHYFAFLYKPDLYAFSNSIKEGKRLENYRELYEEAFNRSKSLYILALLHSKPQVATEAKAKEISLSNLSESEMLVEETGFVYLDPENRVRFFSRTIATGRGASTTHHFETRSNDFTYSVGGDFIGAFMVPSTKAALDMRKSDTTKEMIKAIETLIESLIKERTKLLSDVRDLIRQQPDWGLFDFVYYSAVTLTTLGYGDILPNSTVARLIVLFNSVFGVFFIGFSLILLWTEKDYEKKA